jgi:hypothetical protein
MDKESWNKTLSKNISTALIKLNLNKYDIVFSTQYISDDDTEQNADGLHSYWHINLILIQKTLTDYIFHFIISDRYEAYTYPYYKEINLDQFNNFSEKLSDLKKEIITISEHSYIEIDNFILSWDDYYSYACPTTAKSQDYGTDENLHTEMHNLSIKINELRDISSKKFLTERSKI